MENSLKSYNDGIAADLTSAVCAKAERLWTANIEFQRLVKNVKRAGRAFIKAVVEETWILPLKEESTFYNKAPLCDLFNRPKNGSSGHEAINIVSLLYTMIGSWANNLRVLEYVNRLEDAHKKSIRSNLPISDMWLAAIATGSLIAVGSSPKQRPDWESLSRANKTWDACRTTFCAHQLTLERRQHVTGERGDVFGSAATAINIHGIIASTATPGALLTPNTLAHYAASAAAYQPAREFALQVLDSHLNRMADAATNSGVTLHQLTDSNARPTSATTKQYNTITRLLGDLKTWSASLSTGDAARNQIIPIQ